MCFNTEMNLFSYVSLTLQGYSTDFTHQDRVTQHGKHLMAY